MQIVLRNQIQFCCEVDIVIKLYLVHIWFNLDGLINSGIRQRKGFSINNGQLTPSPSDLFTVYSLN